MLLPFFSNLFIIKPLLNTLKKFFNLFDFFKIYRKVFNIFIIIYTATSKDKKKHVKIGTVEREVLFFYFTK